MDVKMPGKKTIRVIAACLAAAVMASAAHSCANSRNPEPRAVVDALFARYAQGNQPGVGVLVIRDGEVILEECFGNANLETRAPITPETMFRLASVSKQFATMAVMLLEEDGRLDYDDPVADYVPELAGYPGVTIRHLMQHTGGLPDYYDEIDTSGGMPTNADAAAQLARLTDRVLFAPGERYEYSNAGYDMLAPLVEAASGVPFARFMRERVFTPAGMPTAVVHDHTLPAIPHRATGYDLDDGGDGNGDGNGEDNGKGNRFRLDEDSPLNGIVGSGGIYASLRDMAGWDQALYGSKLVSPESLAIAYTSGTNAAGEAIDYGFGWRIGRYDGHLMVWHGGSWVGFRSHILRIPDLRFSVITLSNRGDFDAAAAVRAIAEAYLGAAPDYQ